jgi:hypothetical protein
VNPGGEAEIAFHLPSRIEVLFSAADSGGLPDIVSFGPTPLPPIPIATSPVP